MMKYAILGGGRLARHFSNYFQYLINDRLLAAVRLGVTRLIDNVAV